MTVVYSGLPDVVTVDRGSIKYPERTECASFIEIIRVITAIQ